jgi:ribonuclease J
MHEHARLAKEWGTPHAIQVENGDVIRLAPGEAQKIAQVEAGYLAIDGNYLLSPKSPVMRMRRKMQNDGIIVVTLIMSHQATLRINPIIDAPGCLDHTEDKQIILAISDEIQYVLDEFDRNRPKKLQEEHVVNMVRSAIRRVIRSEVGKNPVIEVNIRKI